MSGRDIQVNPGTLPPESENWSNDQWRDFFMRQSAEREREVRVRNEEFRILREKNDELVSVVREARTSSIYIAVDSGTLCVMPIGRTRPISLYWNEAMGVFSEENAKAVRDFLKDHKHEMAHKGIHWDNRVIRPNTPSNKAKKERAAARKAAQGAPHSGSLVQNQG